jgi:CBS domain protein
MAERIPPDSSIAGSAAEAADAAAQDAQKDHFLQLMFFQGHRLTDAISRSRRRQESEPVEQRTGEYAPLPYAVAKPGDRYDLPVPGARAPVHLDSPAIDVMTDLRVINAVTIDARASLDDANRVMIARGVRALFVADDARHVQGLITASDILGERPVKFAQEHGIRHGELMVRDIMTPSEQLEILAIHDVVRARVGDVVATLKLAGRQHALVVEAGRSPRGANKTVCGIFSLTQIARELGIPPQQVHDIAKTFAEIEAAIAP